MKSFKLTDEEKAIEQHIDNLRPVSDAKRRKIEKIISQAKKNKSISLRISSYDLEKIKEKACLEGIPYQTLINSILHKYITNQLLDKEQIIKSVKLITES
ncbi:antitoxin [bacterium]|nr:antitoxin [bacterium]